jgi:carboxypeptidase Taq
MTTTIGTSSVIKPVGLCNPLFAGTSPKRQMKRLRELTGEIKDLRSLGALAGWDKETQMAPGSIPSRISMLTTMAGVIHQKATSKRIGTLLKTLQQAKNFTQLGPVDQAIVKEVKRNYEQVSKLPAAFVRELSEATTRCNQAWKEARKANDFNHVAPYLEKLVTLNQKEAALLGANDHPYDVLLDQYEQGLTTKVLDPLFATLKQETVPLLKAIQESGKQPNTSFIGKTYPKNRQLAFAKFLSQAMGYDFNRGRLDVSAHPFTTSFGSPFDVRITTRVNELDPRESINATAHESGHGGYELGIDPALTRTVLAGGASMGIHESQSRLKENQVGKSLAFCEFFFPKLKRQFPKQLAGIDAKQFYGAMNEVKPSLIRIAADEMTYNLHIMLRYEIEKDLIEGKLQVKDLPKVWNQKMHDCLGITPEKDSDGVLQDMHWYSGSFGYFPTYTLGNLYAAQFFKAAKQQIPNLESQMRKGNLAPLNQWLNQQIHRVGKMESPEQIAKRVTGEALSPAPFIDYLWEKYGALYGIQRKAS